MSLARSCSTLQLSRIEVPHRRNSKIMRLCHLRVHHQTLQSLLVRAFRDHFRSQNSLRGQSSHLLATFLPNTSGMIDTDCLFQKLGISIMSQGRGQCQRLHTLRVRMSKISSLEYLVVIQKLYNFN